MTVCEGAALYASGLHVRERECDVARQSRCWRDDHAAASVHDRADGAGRSRRIAGERDAAERRRSQGSAQHERLRGPVLAKDNLIRVSGSQEIGDRPLRKAGAVHCRGSATA